MVACWGTESVHQATSGLLTSLNHVETLTVSREGSAACWIGRDNQQMLYLTQPTPIGKETTAVSAFPE